MNMMVMYKQLKKARVLLFISIFAFLLVSCVTRNQLLEEIDKEVYLQNFDAAEQKLEKKVKDIYQPKKDRLLYLLDSGLLSFYSQEYEKSQRKFQEADVLIDQFKTKSASEEFGTFIINDNVRTYAGLGYEHVFNNILLSIHYLLKRNFTGGFVELRRTQNRITKLQTDYNVRLEQYNQNKDAAVKVNKRNLPFVDSAFVRLLSMWIYRADRDYTNLEVAARKFNNAISAQPKIYKNLGVKKINVQNVLQQNFNAPRVQVVAFTGRIPFRVSKRYSFNSVPHGLIFTAREEGDSYSKNVQVVQPSGASIFQAGAVIPIPGMRPGVGLIIDLPYMAKIKSEVSHVKVSINNSQPIQLMKTESLENIALTSFDAESSFIYGKTISRAVVKAAIGAGAAALETTEMGGWAQLLSSAIQIANNLSEKADLRSARYFPAYIWTADIDVSQFINTKASEQKIVIRYYNFNNKVLFEEEKKIKVANNIANLNLVDSTFLR